MVIKRVYLQIIHLVNRIIQFKFYSMAPVIIFASAAIIKITWANVRVSLPITGNIGISIVKSISIAAGNYQFASPIVGIAESGGSGYSSSGQG